MNIAFYIAGAVAIAATLLAITRLNAIHALLYFIVSLLAVAIEFLLLGAPFVAALELIIYAGAIMVLFVFVVMMLNLGEATTEMERRWLAGHAWRGPSILAAILLVETGYLVMGTGTNGATQPVFFGAKQVGIALFGPYAIGVELASMLLLSGLVGAYHLGRRVEETREVKDDVSTARARVDAGSDTVHDRLSRTVGKA